MADETVVVDHNAALAAAVKEQTEQGQAALAALQTHSNANAQGSTVHTAIEGFGKVFEKLGEALHLHKKHTEEAEESQAAALPAGGATEVVASEPEPVVENTAPEAEEAIDPASESSTAGAAVAKE